MCSSRKKSTARWERDRLGQVFTNLLNNAIKYSPDAEKIEIDLRTSEDAVTISVRDHGAARQDF